MSLRHRWFAVFVTFTASTLVLSPDGIRSEEHGSVGLRELIALGLRNDPGLVALRNNIPVEEAMKRAAVQWRDPEIRAGVNRDDNLRIEPDAGGGIDDRDPSGRDQSNQVSVRFFIPKPWEMKALIRQAAREVDLANYQVKAAERQLVLEIREQYEELQFLARKLEASRQHIAIIEEHVVNQKKLLEAGGAFTLDQLSFEEIRIPGLELAVDAAEAELKASKRLLAARVGLSDGARIRATDNLLRSGIDLRSTDLDYLTLMAFANRGEVGVLKHETAIAEAELDRVKSERIPWFNFVETDYAQDYTGGDLTDEAYGVEVAVILPLFSWIAKDERVEQARIQAYYTSLEANQKNIANEVAEAFQSVKDAIKHRDRTREAVARHRAAMKRKAQALEASEDLAAQERLRYDTEMERLKVEEYLLSADRLYNQSLIQLEKSLGADLDQVFKVTYELPGGEIASQPSSRAAPPGMMIRARPVINAAGEETGDADSVRRRKGLFQFLRDSGD